MPVNDCAVSVRGVSKSYAISHGDQGHNTLVSALVDRLRHPLRRLKLETFWALREVSFDIRKGDVVGIIGRNGAGKSTLLKILSRITQPTAGEVHVFGRVGSLLEVGTGFHPELTGRENVFLNGAILGMSKAEIRRQFDAIVDFAGVEKFLDTPVKRYSSGMYVRLAFAVAAHLRSDILIVDEVLAVGDAEFQQKCLGKIKDVSGAGRTVIFVSHNMASVQMLCNRAVVLTSGTVSTQGPVETAISDYMDRGQNASVGERKDRTGNGAARCTSIQLLDESGAVCRSVASGDPLKIRLTLHANRQIPRAFPGINITSALGTRVATFYEGFLNSATSLRPGDNVVELTVKRLDLMPASYRVDVTIGDEAEALDQVENAAELTVTAPRQWTIGRLPQPAEHGLLLAEYGWKKLTDST